MREITRPRAVRWKLLRFLDVAIGAMFLATALLVGLTVKSLFEFAAAPVVEKPWPLVLSIWVACIAAVGFVLLAARPAQWCRGALREPFLRGARVEARERVDALIEKRLSTSHVVLFLHGFGTEAAARVQRRKARDLDALRKLESYFAGRFALLWLWPVVRACRAVWARLPVWRSTDEYLTEALWPDYLVVSVGGCESALGALGATPIVGPDEIWRDRVEWLASVAEAVVVVPGATVGVGEEIRLIAASPALRNKAVFVWPAMEDPHRGVYADASDVVFQSGVRVPHFDEAGLIFDLRGNSEPLSGFLRSPWAVRRIVIDKKWSHPSDQRSSRHQISGAAMITGLIALAVAIIWLSGG